MNRRLYEIEDDLQRLLDEPPEDFDAQLEALMSERADKLDRCWFAVQTLQGEADMLREHGAAIAKRASAAAANVERLKAYIGRCLGQGTKYKSETTPAAFGWRKSEAVRVDNPDAVPDAWCEFERKPVLSEIKKTLKEGGEVPGAALEERLNLQVK